MNALQVFQKSFNVNSRACASITTIDSNDEDSKSQTNSTYSRVLKSFLSSTRQRTQRTVSNLKLFTIKSSQLSFAAQKSKGASSSASPQAKAATTSAHNAAVPSSVAAPAGAVSLVSKTTAKAHVDMSLETASPACASPTIRSPEYDKGSRERVIPMVPPNFDKDQILHLRLSVKDFEAGLWGLIIFCLTLILTFRLRPWISR